MPNTKSAERRVRNSARKQVRNTSVKSRLKSAERGFLELVTSGKPSDAATSMRQVASYYDKAAKSGVIHARTASRKKSRLAMRLKKAEAASAPAAKA